jgi:hypothetical protein
MKVQGEKILEDPGFVEFWVHYDPPFSPLSPDLPQRILFPSHRGTTDGNGVVFETGEIVGEGNSLAVTGRSEPEGPGTGNPRLGGRNRGTCADEIRNQVGIHVSVRVQVNTLGLAMRRVAAYIPYVTKDAAS